MLYIWSVSGVGEYGDGEREGNKPLGFGDYVCYYGEEKGDGYCGAAAY
jgi:hypothetical protein